MSPPPDSGAANVPEISVVVPSHDRPVRLRWLLNALEEQTLPQHRFEVVVAHDSTGPETDRILESHPLAARGVLRRVRLPPGSAPPGANRNAGWRAARAPIIAFTDDDCRPPSDWLERALAAAISRPGAIVQGATLPDPEERNQLLSPHSLTNQIRPPIHAAEACNIVYPREALVRADGFDPHMLGGEDTDLAMRLRAQGVPYVGAEDVVTYHAVHPKTLYGRLRSTTRWQHIPGLVKRHPTLRRIYPLWLFWRPTHAFLPLALAGACASRRNPLALLLLVPWLVHTLPDHGPHPRGRFRALLELPSRAIVDAFEVAVLARGSIRYRTLFL